MTDVQHLVSHLLIIRAKKNFNNKSIKQGIVNFQKKNHQVVESRNSSVEAKYLSNMFLVVIRMQCLLDLFCNLSKKLHIRPLWLRIISDFFNSKGRYTFMVITTTKLILTNVQMFNSLQWRIESDIKIMLYNNVNKTTDQLPPRNIPI